MAWAVTVGTVVEAEATSISVTAPASSSGALLVLCLSQRLRTLPDALTGWTPCGEVTTFSANSGAALWYRIGDGSATDSPTITFGVITQARHAVILKITGQNASPYDTEGTVGSGDTATASTIDTPALTLAAAGELLVAVAVANNSAITYTWPSPWVERVDYGSTGAMTRPHSFSVATREVVASGSYAAETVTLSGTNNRRCLAAVAFKAAAGGSAVGADALHHYREHIMRGAA